MKNTIGILLLGCLQFHSFSQGILAVPGQATMIANQATQISQQATSIAQAVQLLKTAEASYGILQQETQQLVYIKNYMQEASDNLKNLGSIKNLELNRIDVFLNELLCLKGENRYYQLNFMNMVNLITGAFGKCDNSDVFKATWGGLTRNINEQMGANTQNLNQFVMQFNTPQEMIDQDNQVNNSLQVAYTAQQVGSSYREQTQVELATKYKTMSDELMKMSHELNQSLNLEGAEALQVTKGERLILLAKAMDYQMKSMEYEEKYALLIKEGTELSANDRNEMGNYQRAMGLHEMVMFRQ
jgi:hypothetical protein